MTTTLKLKILTNTRERVRADGSTVYVWDGITADGRIVHATMIDSSCIDKFPRGSYLVIKRFILKTSTEIYITIRDPMVDLQPTFSILLL